MRQGPQAAVEATLKAKSLSSWSAPCSYHEPSGGTVDFVRALSVQVRIWMASRACLLGQSLTNALAIYAEESQRTVIVSLGIDTLWLQAAVLPREMQDKEVSLLMKSDIMTELETLHPARTLV